VTDDILSRAMPGEDAPEGVAQVASKDAEREIDRGKRQDQWQKARNWAHVVEAETQGRTQR
jgi:hypothetical protein